MRMSSLCNENPEHKPGSELCDSCQQLASVTSSYKKLSAQTQHSPSSVLCLCIIFIYPHLTLTSDTPEEICSWLWFLFLSILPLSTHKISTLSILSSLYSKGYFGAIDPLYSFRWFQVYIYTSSFSLNMLSWIMCLQKLKCWSPSPSVPLFLEVGLLQLLQVQMLSYWSRVGH